jgi:aminoglycoside phosphotransferase family enzyme
MHPEAPADAPAAAYAAAEQRLRQLQRSPEAFGHPTGTVEWIETHISWLLLAGDFVYKFKKPLKLDFLDFSTPALRRAACEEELRINRRTAPACTWGWWHSAARRAACSAACRSGPGRRGARRAHAPLCAGGAAQPFAGAAAPVAQPHRRPGAAGRAVSCQCGGGHAGQGWGTAQAVRGAGAGLPGGAAAAGGAGVPDMGPALRQVAQWCASQGAALAPVFLQRLQSGRVRECHGDLHLANLVLIDGQPQLFDAIEFNPALRWIDCVADIAFLAMDLEARGRTDLAWRFLNAWLEHTGDYAGLQVLQYYRVYRALVRARVAGMRLAQVEGEGEGGDKRAASLREVRRYLALALRFTEPRTVELWLAHGFSVRAKARSRRR